ncbi:TPA: MobA/MobL family protein [Haemophilus influenzae]
MALFHLESKFHGKTTKSGGAKSVSSIVAYRHCFEMDGFDYTKKQGFVTSFMIFPEDVIQKALDNPNFERFFDAEMTAELKEKIKNGDPRNFWKGIEAKETKKNSQYCEELIISLQHELSLEENIKNLKSLLNEHYIKRGLSADICIHNSKENGNENDNLHAHIIFSHRPITNIGIDLEGNPTYEFGNKIRDQHFNKGFKLDQITPVREMWANLCNNSFKEAGLDIQISDKSLKIQREIALEKGDFQLAAELDRKPAQHIHHTQQNEEELRIKVEQTLRRNEQIQAMNQAAIDLGLDKTDGYEPTPLLEMPAATFKEQLKIRKEQRVKEIIENVTRFIENRANQYSASISQACNRARNVAATVATAIRNKQNRLFNKVISNNFQSAREHVEKLAELGELKRASNELFRKHKERLETQKTKQLQNELSNEVDQEVKQQQRRNLWFDPYAGYKPKNPWEIR